MSEFDNLHEDVRYIREKVDTMDTKLDSYQLRTEHRLTKAETKASFFGILAGLLSGFFSPFKGQG